MHNSIYYRAKGSSCHKVQVLYNLASSCSQESPERGWPQARCFPSHWSVVLPNLENPVCPISPEDLEMKKRRMHSFLITAKGNTASSIIIMIKQKLWNVKVAVIPVIIRKPWNYLKDYDDWNHPDHSTIAIC